MVDTLSHQVRYYTGEILIKIRFTDIGLHSAKNRATLVQTSIARVVGDSWASLY